MSNFSLSPMHTNALKDYFAIAARETDGLGFYGLHGFLFALAGTPEELESSTWLPIALDIADDENGAEASTASNAALALHQLIGDAMNAGAPAIPPECIPMTSDDSDNFAPSPIQQWAFGFLTGYRYAFAVWEPYCIEELEQELATATLVLSFFGDRTIAAEMHKAATGSEAKFEFFARKMAEMFPIAASTYAGIGNDVRAALQEMAAEARANAQSNE